MKSQQTVRSRLQLRVQELEDEIKKMKEDAEKASKETTEEVRTRGAGCHERLPLRWGVHVTRLADSSITLEGRQS